MIITDCAKKTASHQFLCSYQKYYCGRTALGMCISLLFCSQVRLYFVYSMPSDTIDMISTSCYIRWGFTRGSSVIHLFFGKALRWNWGRVFGAPGVWYYPLLICETVLTHASVSTNFCDAKHRPGAWIAKGKSFSPISRCSAPHNFCFRSPVPLCVHLLTSQNIF